jgi:SGNH domain (fused to AT3 domains)
VERVVERGDPCAIRGDATLDPRCLAKAEGDSLGLLIGDSHARALYPVLRAVVQSHGQRLISLFSLGCAPLLSPAGTYSPSNAAYCARRNDTGLRSIAAAAGNRLDFAIIEASWLFYGLDRELNLADAVAAPVSAAKAGVADRRFSDRLAVTIQRQVIDMHVRRIILVGPVPLAPHDVPA